MTSPESTRKLPVTKVLVAFSLLLVIFLCGGGLLYVDYHAGSLSSTLLPADDGTVMEVSARWRGFSGGGTRVGSNSTTGEVLLGIGEQEFTVARETVKYQGKVLVELPAGASSVEVVAYRGSIQIIVDGEMVTSLSIEED